MQEVVDTGGGRARDVDVAEPPGYDASVLGLDEGVVVALAGGGLGEVADVELVQEFGDPVVDVLRAVVGVEGLDGKGEGGDEGLEDGDEVVLGDVGDRTEVLELGHLVDDVDDVDSFVALPVAEVDGVDAQKPGLAFGRWLAALADAHRGGARLAEGEAADPVGAALPQVVDVAVGDRGGPLETLVAVDLVFAPEDLLRGRARELAVGLVDLGQQSGVAGRVAVKEGPGRGLLSVVTEPSGPAVLPDEAGDLGPGEARRLLEEALDHPLVGLPEARIKHLLESPADEGVGPVAVDVADLGQLGTFHEGPHLVDGTDLVGREIHDHTPMIAAPRPSGSSLPGNQPPL